MHEDFLPVVFCPVCCTAGDAEGWGLQEFVCSNCESGFSVRLERDKVALHSMHA